MRKVTINVALQNNRSNKIIPFDLLENKDSLDSVTPVALSNMSEEEILHLIAHLPDQYRLVFNLSVIDGYNHKEIGEKLNISEVTSRSNLSRAKAIMRKKIASLENIVLCPPASLEKN